MKPFDCTIRQLEAHPIAVVALDGDVDSLAALKLKEALRTVVESGVRHVVIDMSRVGYVNSTGWSVLVSRDAEMRRLGGGIRVAEMAPDVWHVFDSLGFGEVLEPFANLDDATADCQSALRQSSPPSS